MLTPDWTEYSESSIVNKLKGHRTSCNSIAKSIDSLVTRQKAKPSKQNSVEILRELSNFNQKIELMHSAYVHLSVYAEEDKNQEKAQKRIAELDQEKTDVRSAALDAVQLAPVNPSSATRPEQDSSLFDNSGPPPVPPHYVPPARIQEQLRPDKLSHDATPDEYRTWLRMFASFWRANNLGRQPCEDQQAWLLTCIDKRLASRLNSLAETDLHVFPIDPSDPDEDCCISLLQAEFLRTHPLAARRHLFYSFVPPKGMSMSSIDDKLTAMFHDADIDDMTADEHLAIRLIGACPDEELRNKLLELDDPLPEDVRKTYLLFDKTKATQSAMARNNTTTPLAAALQQRRRPNPLMNNIHLLNGRCSRCGATNHQSPACRANSKTLSCTFCKRPGHIETVCLKKLTIESKKTGKARTVTAPPANPDINSLSLQDDNAVNFLGNAFTINAASHQPTPLLPLSLSDNISTATLNCTPDTGCTRTVFKTSTLNRLNLKFDPYPNALPLRAANNSQVLVNGRARLKATTKAGASATLDALVVDNLSNDALISWHDLLALKILSPSFPTALSVAPSDTLDTIKEDFKDVLSDKLSDKPVAGPPMHIHLKDNVKPRRVCTARQIPTHFAAAAKSVIDDLLNKNVIKRVTEPTDWISPAFFVPKQDNKRVRLVTDYTSLNKYVRRPVHPFPSSRDIMQAIPHTAKFFAKLDAVHGYFQIALDHESSLLTTFLLPSGRYRYLRAPMGLSASSDEWCARSDITIADLDFCKKIVDDILVWADTLALLLTRLRIILSRCRTHNVTISMSKLCVGTSIPFAGFLVTDNGIKPDPAQTAALTNFPAPKTLKDLRAFLGLANQLASFVPDFAQMTPNLRELLKKKNAWLWTPEHTEEFNKVKTLLTSDMVIKPFDPALDTLLVTDASRLFGLGYALMQRSSPNRIVQCGSRSLTDAQKRYATIELEMLAISWAVPKLAFYLRGLPKFTVYCDHRPLEGVFRKDLHAIDNPRLQRMREKLSAYSFEVLWISGKSNLISDCLSRFPVFPAEPDEDTHHACLATINTLTMQELHAAANTCPSYQAIISALATSPFHSNEKETSPCPTPELAKAWPMLSLSPSDNGTLILYNASRILVPDTIKPRILKALHAPHAGLVKTQTLASQLYYWPTMNNDIKTTIQSCTACKKLMPSQPPAPLRITEANTPMHSVGTDLFDHTGTNWLVLVDRFSGFILASKMNKTTTEAVTKRLRSWFIDLGFPHTIRSDGGPQFRTDFQLFCESNGIKHELASAYHPQSNGLAEAAVKSAKHLLIKCSQENEDFDLALATWRNTPRADGYSPAQLFFGRRQRQPSLPTLPHHHNDINPDAAHAARNKTRFETIARREPHATELPQLNNGDLVRVQNPHTKLWDSTATIAQRRPDGLSYIISQNGKLFLRNRKFLKPEITQPSPPTTTSATKLTAAKAEPTLTPHPAAKEETPLRRSSRLAHKQL